MKKEIKIYSLVAIMILACSISANAQQKQKPSDRDFKEEIRKANEKRAARNNYVNKIRQSTPAESQAPKPAGQDINTGAALPATIKQSPANVKPSQQAMIIPAKRTAVKQ